MTAPASRTPGPWRIDYTDGTMRDANERIIMFLPAAMAEEPDVANRVVHACNAHDDLVAALREIIAKFEETETCDYEYVAMDMTEIARAALKRAEEQ